MCRPQRPGRSATAYRRRCRLTVLFDCIVVLFDLDTSGTVQWDNENLNRNLYGCLPCPRCGSKCRAAYRKTMTVDCDDCGFAEPAVFAANDGVK